MLQINLDRVLRNENTALWQRYCTYREEVRDKIRGSIADKMELPNTTKCVHKRARIDLDQEVNEVYLLHGTDAEAAEYYAQAYYRCNA